MNHKTEQIRLKVGDKERRAVAYVPDKPSGAMAFVFHGHGGTAEAAARKFALHEHLKGWLVVYPQGLPNYGPVSRRTANGWQHSPEEDGGRDLAFVDALLTELNKRHRIDATKRCACGMSNGGLFTVLLLKERPKEFAAFAEAGGGGARFAQQAKTPKPLLIIHGKSDALVDIATARRLREAMIRLNRCEPKADEWAPGYLRNAPKDGKNPVIIHEFNGGHEWPSDASKMIARFFKEQTG
ncbi:MAG: dienelactone hydrolase family protein [Armatimonadetes bacterium]|nr:dienelactone hydrolase family protein [Armatimonadota bacterium]